MLDTVPTYSFLNSDSWVRTKCSARKHEFNFCVLLQENHSTLQPRFWSVRLSLKPNTREPYPAWLGFPGFFSWGNAKASLHCMLIVGNRKPCVLVTATRPSKNNTITLQRTLKTHMSLAWTLLSPSSQCVCCGSLVDADAEARVLKIREGEVHISRCKRWPNSFQCRKANCGDLAQHAIGGGI